MKAEAETKTDHDLIAEFKSGSMDAMEGIVDRYEGRIFSFARKMCGDFHDAEDIVQDTFLSAFRYLKDFREEAKLVNWLFKIASRACIRKRRKKKCEPDEHLSIDSYGGENGSATYEIPDWTNDPSDGVMRAELQQIIDKAVHSLTQNHRLIFNLRDIQGFSTEETAEILDMSIPAVKTGLHRARIALRDAIGELYREVKAA